MKTIEPTFFQAAGFDGRGREQRRPLNGAVIDCEGFTQRDLPDGRVELFDAGGGSCGLFVGKQTLRETLRFLGR